MRAKAHRRLPPSHYWSQYWPGIRNILKRNFTRNANPFVLQTTFERGVVQNRISCPFILNFEYCNNALSLFFIYIMRLVVYYHFNKTFDVFSVDKSASFIAMSTLPIFSGEYKKFIQWLLPTYHPLQYRYYRGRKYVWPPDALAKVMTFFKAKAIAPEHFINQNKY